MRQTMYDKLPNELTYESLHCWTIIHQAKNFPSFPELKDFYHLFLKLSEKKQQFPGFSRFAQTHP